MPGNSSCSGRQGGVLQPQPTEEAAACGDGAAAALATFLVLYGSILAMQLQ